MGKLNRESLAHQIFACGGFVVGRAAWSSRWSFVLCGGIESGERERVAGFVGVTAAKGIDDALLLSVVPVLDGVPMHAVGPRGDVIELRVAEERTQFFFVEGDGLARGYRAARASRRKCPA